MTFNKKKIAGNFVAAVAGLVVSAIVGTIAGEKSVYSILTAYTFGALAHPKVAELIQKRMK